MSTKQISTPKTLLILRHAKSDKPIGVEDFNRSLNDRGLRDAPAMGKLIKIQGIVPDLIISSRAKRAYQTAQLAAETCGYKGDIETHQELYEASIENAIHILRGVSNTVHIAMLVGHNPDLQMLIRALTNQDIELPTAGLVEIQLEISKWQNLNRSIGQVKHTWHP